ncbi:YraN family protein [Altibacter sp. HG106]|uniref:YraN family protein n=1 Tax=Altibacter sp. HG106 TaxID=3023937 RepID=UPI00234FCCCE|nr:YraN family protein [Altibacter sp. HG106]MDC7994819.1 YraN family protein [Altibacter sp. HG106]
MAYHNELGRWGEAFAVAYFEQNGYEVLERNFRFQKAEIDIIARREQTLVVVEVKTRNSAYFGNPQEFVTASKIKLLVKAANEYVISNQLDVNVRFDIIAIIKNKQQEELTHYKDAFYHF